MDFYSLGLKCVKNSTMHLDSPACRTDSSNISSNIYEKYIFSMPSHTINGYFALTSCGNLHRFF